MLGSIDPHALIGTAVIELDVILARCPRRTDINNDEVEASVKVMAA